MNKKWWFHCAFAPKAGVGGFFVSSFIHVFIHDMCVYIHTCVALSAEEQPLQERRPFAAGAASWARGVPTSFFYNIECSI